VHNVALVVPTPTYVSKPTVSMGCSQWLTHCCAAVLLCSSPQVQIQCLNSVAPAPLNWKMWCPGTDAKVVGWQDKSGAAHRQITLRPQAGMTSTMYQWFITSHVLGLMPPVVEYQGNVSGLLSRIS
jgi:hypothetical protein